MSGSHNHPHVSELRTTSHAQRRALWWSLGLNVGFLVAEIIGGLAFGSLALLADAAHMVSDVGALAVSLIAFALAERPASRRHTYGLQRAEVLGAQLNALVLIAVAGWIVLEAFRRVGETVTIKGGGVIVIALLGLFINAVSAWLLARAAGRSLNMRGAYWHMASDALGSIAALAAGISVLLFNATWVDVAASIGVAVLVVLGGARLLRDTTRVLLEAAPTSVDQEAIVRAIEATPGVDSVHHLHLWMLGSESIALSAHVVLGNGRSMNLHDAQTLTDELKRRLGRDFGVDHATIETECHVGGETPVEVTRR